MSFLALLVQYRMLIKKMITTLKSSTSAVQLVEPFHFFSWLSSLFLLLSV